MIFKMQLNIFLDLNIIRKILFFCSLSNLIEINFNIFPTFYDQ